MSTRSRSAVKLQRAFTESEEAAVRAELKAVRVCGVDDATCGGPFLDVRKRIADDSVWPASTHGPVLAKLAQELEALVELRSDPKVPVELFCKAGLARSVAVALVWLALRGVVDAEHMEAAIRLVKEDEGADVVAKALVQFPKTQAAVEAAIGAARRM